MNISSKYGPRILTTRSLGHWYRLWETFRREIRSASCLFYELPLFHWFVQVFDLNRSGECLESLGFRVSIVMTDESCVRVRSGARGSTRCERAAAILLWSTTSLAKILDALQLHRNWIQKCPNLDMGMYICISRWLKCYLLLDKMRISGTLAEE